jgi:hypothetical protein
MAVISSVLSLGYTNKSIGIRINPPPAPIRVPKAPINKPKGNNHKYSMGIYKPLFPFNLEFRKTLLHTQPHTIRLSSRANARDVGFLAGPVLSTAEGLEMIR